MTNIHNHKILILDFGSQYTQLIARRVREIGVYCELWAWDVTEEQIREFNPDGIIFLVVLKVPLKKTARVHLNMYLMQVCLYWVFVTVCKPWRCNLAV